MNKKKSGGAFFYLLLLGILVFSVVYSTILSRNNFDYTHIDFVSDLAKKNIDKISIVQNEEVPSGTVIVDFKSGDSKKFYTTDVNRIIEEAEEAQVVYGVSDIDKPHWFWTDVFPFLILGLIVLMFYMSLTHALGGGNSQLMNFGKSRAEVMMPGKMGINFSKVAGLYEEKEEMQEVVDFLANPKKYLKVGARIPKGILMEGPPGTGKTLLAKAVAGEAGVPFFSISGSDFVEMFVGVGASRVRDLFDQAKHNCPCIVFVDEIDAVARKRGSGLGGGHDEREQTLNQLLVEMDGFSVNEGIIVLAATNRVDILDPAILRAGRFDRKVLVGRPDVRGRKEILKVHSANKPLSEDVNLDHLAQITAGFTGADLENLMNEAAISAAKADRAFINDEDVKKSLIRVGVGTEKRSRVVSEKERRITAYHEAGHAILFHVLPDVGPVYNVSIIPTGSGAAGYTMPLPERDDMFMTKGKMTQQIIVDLGGRVAESLVFDDITTGASMDIKQATQTARAMITKYGFSEALGTVNYDMDDEEVFIGRDLAHPRSYSENVANTIDEEVRKIIDHCYQEAERLIKENLGVLNSCAELLLEKERITKEEFEALFGIVPEQPLITDIPLE
ncbi:MAG: ATP-dependent zinc metalloprotease FtsH [Lachnospiraceae bacterium]|nr:ATP-dependent zinc metalloprotease FtsH [Lachnospiraceae bacterium]